MLIFDEVLCGFRTERRRRAGAVRRHAGHDDARQGARRRHRAERVRRQPRGDVVGRRRSGRAVHSGTYNAHLVPILAGLAFLDQATDPDFYPRLPRSEDVLLPGARRRSSTGPGSTSACRRTGRASACCSGSTTSRATTATCSSTTSRMANRFYGLAMRRRRVLPRRAGTTASAPATPATDLADALERSSRRHAGSPAKAPDVRASPARRRRAPARRSSAASSTSSTASRSGRSRSRTSRAPATTPRDRTSSPRRGAKRPELAAIRDDRRARGDRARPDGRTSTRCSPAAPSSTPSTNGPGASSSGR